MYAWLWRTLPGGTSAKTAQAIVLLVAVLALLMLAVFPWASHHVPFLRVTVEDPAGGTSTASSAPAAFTPQEHSVPSGGTTPSMRNPSTAASTQADPLL